MQDLYHQPKFLLAARVWRFSDNVQCTAQCLRNLPRERGQVLHVLSDVVPLWLPCFRTIPINMLVDEQIRKYRWKPIADCLGPYTQITMAGYPNQPELQIPNTKTQALNSKPASLNPKPGILIPKPQPQSLNPKPETKP